MQEEDSPRVKDILLLLGIGALVVGGVVFPGLPLAIKFLNKQDRSAREKLASFNRRLFRQQLKRLIAQGDVEVVVKDGQTIADLTNKGKSRLDKFKLDDLEIKRPKKWDGLWRLVIFDIPETKKVAREFLRKKLKGLGFFRLQESVFIYPFDCREEINFIKEEYSLTNEEVLLLTVENIEGQKLDLAVFQ